MKSVGLLHHKLIIQANIGLLYKADLSEAILITNTVVLACLVILNTTLKLCCNLLPISPYLFICCDLLHYIYTE